MRVYLGKKVEKHYNKRKNKYLMKHLRGEVGKEELESEMMHGFTPEQFKIFKKCVEDGTQRRIQNYMIFISFFLGKNKGDERLSPWFFYTELYLVLFEFKVGLRKFN